MVLVAPAGLARKGTLIQFRLASIPFVGEMMLQPSAERLRTFWSLAFRDQSFVTSDFISRRLRLAMQPGAKEAFLKTLRSGVDVFGFHSGHVNAINAALPKMNMPALVIWGMQDKCGHLPQIECAEKFNEAALAFCAFPPSTSTL
jgi:pimeloyl-ACP methyl ester carboxylesterase